MARTLTEAQAQNGIVVVYRALNSTISNSRTVPYAERYSQSNGVMETPAQRLQRAGEDEARKKASR